MAHLNKQQKAFLVQCLAEWHSLSEAARLFRDRYGLDLTLQQIERYDPTKVSGQQLSKQLRDLFDKHRNKYMRDTKDHIPIANKTVRLRKLAASAEVFERTGNHLGLLKVLEQAAKEMGGSYTNQRQFTGKDGGPIQTEDVTKMPTEQIEAELRAYGIDPDAIAPPSRQTTH